MYKKVIFECKILSLKFAIFCLDSKILHYILHYIYLHSIKKCKLKIHKKAVYTKKHYISLKNSNFNSDWILVKKCRKSVNMHRNFLFRVKTL